MHELWAFQAWVVDFLCAGALLFCVVLIIIFFFLLLFLDSSWADIFLILASSIAGITSAGPTCR